MLISGTDKTVGAKYRYPAVTNVDGTDVDAIVTIVKITNATIVDVDNLNNGGGSLKDRFQPVISTSQVNGNVEFQFTFYKGGTFNTAQQLKIDLSSFILEVLDLDGNEFFDVARPNNENYTLESKSFITVSTITPYTRFQGPSNSVDPISIANTRYIAAINFGTLHAINFRLGNSSRSSNRQSSISFGEVRFTIPKAPIANDDSSLCKLYGSVTQDVTTNDVDSNQNIDKVTVDLNPSQFGIQTSLTVLGQGTWSINSSGIVTFVPLAIFKNNPTPINYTIKDLTGLISNEAKITITFVPNQPTSNGNISECEATPIQTLNANTALSSTTGITWYDSATNGNIVSNPTLKTVDSITYYAEYSNGTCSSLNRTAVKLTITPAIAFTATPTQPKCFGEKGSVVLSTPTGGTGTITFNATATTNLAAGNHTYTATDANGCSKSITVTIKAAPTEIACSISGSDGPLCPSSTFNNYSAPISGNYEWSISGNGLIAGSTNSQSVSVTASAGCNSTFLLSLIITGANGCISTCTKIVTVVDDTLPIVTTAEASLNQTLQCNDRAGITAALALSPAATDNCVLAPTKILVSDVTTADANCANAYVRVRTWNFTDGCANTSANFVQTITVIDNTTPTWSTLTTALNTTLECSNTEALARAQAAFPIATDLCDATVTNISKVSGAFVASESCANAGTYTNTWTVVDGCGNTSEVFTQVITIQDTTAPTWSTAATALNTTVECSNTEALASAQAAFPIATDLCDATVINISKVSGAFVASESCANAGTYTNTWTVVDDCGNTSEVFTQIITIQDTTAPTWSTAATALNTTVECSNAEALATAQTAFPIATDLCDATVANISKVSGVFIASESCANAGTYTNTWTVADDCGNTSEVFTQIITIQDTTAPTWSTAATALNTTLECSNAEALAKAQAAFPTATDLCDATVTNISKVSGAFVASESCANAGTYTNTWTAADDCGNTSEVFTQIITIQDTTAPVITTLPAVSTISCAAILEFAVATATDNCGADVKLTSVDVTTRGDCAGSYSVTRTWTSTDTCGNKTTATQTINVIDKTGPTTNTAFTTPLNVNCDAIPAKPDLIFVDNCSTVSTPIFTENIINRTDNSYSIVRKWLVSDTCGNTSDFTQIINVTIANSNVLINNAICNDGNSTTTDLNNLLPAGISINSGAWIDINSSGGLLGNLFNAIGLPIGDYNFEYKVNDTTCPRTIRVIITVNTGCGGTVLSCGSVVVHNAFSPNGDGINEKFVIDNIDDTVCYPDNTVEIYNRWGVLVYETKGYNNTSNAFEGISVGRSIIQQSTGLPTGTYFYILSYTSLDGTGKTITNKKDGYLYLSK
ncbi:gliding motility-associated C-terminal domain-containing protein [Flavobacterium sp. XS1P32]|uniref:HYR-like domain-containing protein n=1 Tax=unclassified Flavobacterium TaxID=196869 RepID=UPI003AAF2768